MKYNTIKDNQSKFIESVKNSVSIAEVCRLMNLRYAGGTYKNIKSWILKLNLNTDHFKGQGWSKDSHLKPVTKYRKKESVTKYIMRIRGKQCENCKRKTWCGKPIPLETHHIDGNPLNNIEENLQILCNNCHALTENYRNRKRNGS